MGELVSLREYAGRKTRLERVAMNEALLREAWEREEALRRWQFLWRSHPKRRRS
jgi:hypothetical protein